MKTSAQWLPLDVAAKQYDYAHKESLSRRLRQLRQQGYVVDIGRPPAEYPTVNGETSAAIVMMWPNPKTALLRADAPKSLLQAISGRPKKSEESAVL